MAWDSVPPTKEELVAPEPQATTSWDAAPPTKEELYHATDKSSGDAAIMGAQNIFGLRPVAAGVGGFLGAGVGSLQAGKGLGESYNAAKAAYPEARSGALEEQENMKAEHPIAFGAGELAGDALTAPLLGFGKAGMLMQGARGGLLTGLGTALSKGEDLSKVVEEGAKGGAIGAAIPAGLKGAGMALKTIGPKIATLAGPSEETIRHYASKVDDINKLIKSHDGDMASMADEVRQGIQDQIKSWKGSMSSKIGQAMESSHPDTKLELAPVIYKLNAAKSKINTKLYPEAANEIQDQIDKISSLSDSKEVSVSQMHEIKEFLQDRAKGSYSKGGQIFQSGKDAAIAAKQAGAVARKTVNSAAPEYAEANNKLALLHSLEENLNKNMITPGKPDASLLAAGANTTSRGAKNLKKLGGLINQDVLGQAKDLNAAKTFSNPELFSTHSTGKSLLGTFLGAAAGSVAGPLGAKAGGLIGGAVSSPAAIKGLINAFNVAQKAGDTKTMKALAPYMQSMVAEQGAR